MSNLDYPDYIRSLEQDSRTLVLVERPSPAVAIVRLNDPENQNALSGPLTVQLRRALEQLVADAEQAVLAEEFAEPSTFTTRAHQETVRALLAKIERAGS